MYTPYIGPEFLDAYVEDRIDSLKRLSLECPDMPDDDVWSFLNEQASLRLGELFSNQVSLQGKQFVEFLADVGECPESLGSRELKLTSRPLSDFSLASSFPTMELVDSLIQNWLSKSDLNTAMMWMNRLVQRFEVSKKLDLRYSSGFRKGVGGSSDIRLYWRFALCLSLSQAETRNLQHLSTLLKVCDLILSQPASLSYRGIPLSLINVVVVSELFSVKMLLDDKGVLTNVE